MANVMGKEALKTMIHKTKASIDSSRMEDENYTSGLSDDMRVIGSELEMEQTLVSDARDLLQELKNQGFDAIAQDFEIDLAYAIRNLEVA